MKIFLKLLLALILVLAIIFFGSRAWKDYQVSQDQRRYESLYKKILEGSSTKPVQVTIDYKKPITTGSPLIFGGSHTPPAKDIEVWDKLQSVGITSVRKDIFLERILPKGISLLDYKNNKGNVQEVNNWNRKYIDEIKKIMEIAKQRNMKVVGILSYAPSWITYSETSNGMPKDWALYEDIVRKIYRIYRPYLDYIEIWNEPDLPFDKYYLDTSGTDISKKEAYLQIYKHASGAIRDVDHEINDGKYISLGGPAAAKKDSSDYVEDMLLNKEINKNVNFVSYHQYEPIPSESNVWFKTILNKYGKTNIPIFITEWSYSSKPDIVEDTILTKKGITYASNMFINYLKMGITAANYHTLTIFDENKPDGIAKNHSFYKKENGKVVLLPLAKSWLLFSKTMGLGNGISEIYDMKSFDSKINGIGIKNSSNEYGFILVNNKDESKLINVKLTNLPMRNFINMTIYSASENTDPSIPIYKGDIKFKERTTDITVYIPSNSILGVTILNDNFYNFLNF